MFTYVLSSSFCFFSTGLGLILLIFFYFFCVTKKLFSSFYFFFFFGFTLILQISSLIFPSPQSLIGRILYLCSNFFQSISEWIEIILRGIQNGKIQPFYPNSFSLILQICISILHQNQPFKIFFFWEKFMLGKKKINSEK